MEIALIYRWALVKRIDVLLDIMVYAEVAFGITIENIIENKGIMRCPEI